MIPQEIQVRSPLLKEEWMDNFNRIREHNDAPKWNTVCGDRIQQEDLDFIQAFRLDMIQRNSHSDYPSKKILNWIESLVEFTPIFQERLSNLDLHKDFFLVQPMNREDIAAKLDKIVPYNASLERLIKYSTSGTTGHAIQVPNHPKSIACYDVMIQYILDRFHVQSTFSDKDVACILVCFQDWTITYSTVHTQLNGAGYAKINLNPNDWTNSESPARFIDDLKPIFLAGDPISFAELLNHNINHKPKALLSTALSMTDGFRQKLEDTYLCPVIDFYSLNETGPIAYSCPKNKSVLHILPSDLYVEILDENGVPLPENQLGEITVTGGRNPYLPLLRYRTGDSGKLDFSPCDCGERTPKLLDMNGRKAVLMKKSADQILNTIDVSRIVRKYPVIQYQFKQQKNLSCTLRLRTSGSFDFYKDQLTNELKQLLGPNITLKIIHDTNLGKDGKKIQTFVSELEPN